MRCSVGMNIIIGLLVNAVVVLVLSWLLPGIHLSGFGSAVITVAVLAIVNAFLRPIVEFLTLPINILTLGLFSFVINALLIMLVSALVPGFVVESFWWALLFSVLLALVGSVLP